MSGEAFDYKKEFRDSYDLYAPKDASVLVDGEGNPNGNPDFQEAIELLYDLSFTIKMSKMKGNQPEGYFESSFPRLRGSGGSTGADSYLMKRTTGNGLS